MSYMKYNGEWCASYKGAIGWGASVREATLDCWDQYTKYYC